MATRNRLLIGQIALDLQFLTREQLQECIDLQAGQVQAKPIGTILLENRFLSATQLAAVLAEQQRRLNESLPYAPKERGAVAFGRLIIERGLVTPEHVNQALRAQQDLAERGIRKRLGELLVEAGHLEADAVPEVLKSQGKTLMACTFCGAHLNVLTDISPGYPCRKCGMPLDEKTGIVSADDTAYLLPVRDPRPPSGDTPRQPVAQAAPEPAPDAAGASPMRADLLRRVAQILTILAVLTLLLWLLSKN